MKVKNISGAPRRFWCTETGNFFDFKVDEEKELNKFDGRAGFELVKPKKVSKPKLMEKE